MAWSSSCKSSAKLKRDEPNDYDYEPTEITESLIQNKNIDDVRDVAFERRNRDAARAMQAASTYSYERLREATDLDDEQTSSSRQPPNEWMGTRAITDTPRPSLGDIYSTDTQTDPVEEDTPGPLYDDMKGSNAKASCVLYEKPSGRFCEKLNASSTARQSSEDEEQGEPKRGAFSDKISQFIQDHL